MSAEHERGDGAGIWGIHRHKIGQRKGGDRRMVEGRQRLELALQTLRSARSEHGETQSIHLSKFRS